VDITGIPAKNVPNSNFLFGQKWLDLKETQHGSSKSSIVWNFSIEWSTPAKMALALPPLDV
jgi:hypothetical protein